MEEVQVLLSTYGLWFVALVVTADQLGIPIPAPPALVVCGGLVGTGQLDAGATLPLDADHEERGIYIVQGEVEIAGEDQRAHATGT